VGYAPLRPFCWLAALCLLSSVAWAATPPNTPITNTAQATYEIGGALATVTGAVTVTTASQTPATIEFLRYSPAVANGTTVVATTQCNSVTLPHPTVRGAAAPLNIPGAQPLSHANTYVKGDIVFVKVTDYDRNQDSLLAETLTITLNTSGGDNEILTLTETGVSTGVFVGYIQSVSGTTATHNCLLNVGSNTQLGAIYFDGTAGTTLVPASALIDPFGIVFDSVTGLFVDGVSVTIINVATGLPATVFGNDGVSSFPSTVITGSIVTDAGGEIYNLAGGLYQFPLMAAGTYRLQITPPIGFAFPSTVPNATLQTLAGAPFALVAGARGENFALVDVIVRIDIPLDPVKGRVEITKSAGKATVAVGDYVPYTLSIRNPDPLTVAAVQIADRLPMGFRYQKGSARLDAAVLADPVIAADGRSLTFSLGDIAAGMTVSVKYVAAVVAGAKPGPAENTAQAVGVASNVARASVLVREDLHASRAILMGRVIVGACDDDVENDLAGLEKIRIVLQDGTYILTDKEGRWHADNIRPGTHVVQLDLDSLPKGYAVVACENNSRFAGRNYSQFVNVRGGSLWRADFYVQKAPAPVAVVTPVVPPAPVIDLPPVCMPEPEVVLPLSDRITIFADINFEFDKTLLRDEAKADLDNLANQLKQWIFTTIRITRYTERLGSAKYNQALSLKRAKAVKDYLISTGISPDQITSVGSGKNSPISLCDLLRGKARIKCLAPDRRIAIDISGFAQAIAPTPQLSNCMAPAEHAKRLAALTFASQSVAVQAIAPVADLSTNAQTSADTSSVGRATPGLVIAAETPLVETQLVEKLPFDETWLATATPGAEWLHPQESFQPALPAVKIAVKHDPAHRVEIKVNGEPVNALRFEGITRNPADTVALSLWRAVDIKEGSNLLELTVLDAQDNIVKQEQRKLHYGGASVKAVFDEKRSVLVADGKTRPVLAVRFLDKDGKPVRRGVSGEFHLNAPYLAQSKLDGIERQPLSGNPGNKPRFTVTDDGVALIELQPTTQTGEVLLGFDLGTASNLSGAANALRKDRQVIRVWLAPGERDWILVGFAEGTVGLKRLSGNMENLRRAEADEKLFDQNRIAFYAKGMIKGDYLITAAYDTARETGAGRARNLKQAINPNQYYTLYADATTAQFDAARASKLYLKIEKKQFYALFGDYDTGLSVTELGRYSRTLNGIKSEFKGDKISYNAFATLTAQSYKKDEIQGDGTSGLYRLTSREIVLNSDKVSMEIRDRFQSQVIISRRTLTRFLDYDLDSTLGTLFFREPIPSRDSGFNPVFIVVEYEAEDVADRKMSGGGRIAYKTGEKSEVGVTRIHEGNIGKSADLTAADATLQLTETTRLRAELASSQRDINNVEARGNAWLVETRHEGENLTAKVYVRETGTGFGLGQQAGAEVGMRKFGGDMRLKIDDHLQLQGGASKQENLATNAQRDTLEAQAQWQKDNLITHAGLRNAQDKDALGIERESLQALTGGAYAMLNKKLTLTANSEIAINGGAGSTDFPNRLGVGADYKISQQTSVFAKHELARGSVSADTTLIGLRTRPWEGGEISSSLGNHATQDSARLFTNAGLVQRWQVNERWQADFGLDRSQTLSATATNPLNDRVPLASGTPIAAAPGIVTDNYTAGHLGAGYHNKIWSGNGRIELRNSETDDKVNVLLGAQRTLDAGRSVAAGLGVSKTSSIVSRGMKLDARLSYAHRPNDSRWVWLDRLDYMQESISSAASNQKARKLVNNFNANYMPNRRTQIALQYGSKFVLDSIDGRDYDGYTDLIGLEARRDLGHRWDVGVNAGTLHSWKAGTRNHHLGASVGYRLMDNAWLSLGYNRLGFIDANFSGAEYRAQGIYINLRVKVDQNTLRFNEKKRNPESVGLALPTPPSATKQANEGSK